MGLQFQVTRTSLLILVIGAVMLFLVWHSTQTNANLGWDDAEYLAWAMDVVNKVEAASPLKWLSAVMETPRKPPFLAAWGSLVVALLGRDHLAGSLALMTLLPFCASLILLARIARSLAVEPSVALIVYCGMPLILGLSNLLLVEVWMSIMIMGTIACLTSAARQYSLRFYVGIAVFFGLGMWIKSSMIAFCLPPLLWLSWVHIKDRGISHWLFRISIWAALFLAISSPWYLKNWASFQQYSWFATHFMLFTKDAVNPQPSIFRVIPDSIGWFLIILVVLSLLHPRSLLRAYRSQSQRFRYFTQFTLLSACCGLLPRLYLPNYPPRFWAPACVSLAPVIAWLLSYLYARTFIGYRILVVVGLGASVINSVYQKVSYPVYETSWTTLSPFCRESAFPARTIAIVGDTAEWNIFKARLLDSWRRCGLSLDDPAHFGREPGVIPPETIPARLTAFEGVVLSALSGTVQLQELKDTNKNWQNFHDYLLGATSPFEVVKVVEYPEIPYPLIYLLRKADRAD